MFRHFSYLCFLPLLTILLALGCKSSDPDSPPKPEDPDEVEEVLLEPFDPPPLEELDAQVTWEDQPVVDPIELLREKQASERPLASVEEALLLRNNSSEENEKILNALGRLPASPDNVNWDASISRFLGADIKSSNPLMINSTAEFDVLGLTGLEIFSFDWNMTPMAVADTVKSWQTSSDRMYDKIVLRR